MKFYNKLFGDQGENYVISYLEKSGHTILEKQFSINKKIGEVDIIAKKDNIFIFVEVKNRKKNHSIEVFEMISRKKQKAIINMAFCFFQKNNIFINDYIVRFDIAIILEGNLQYYQNAFTL